MDHCAPIVYPKGKERIQSLVTKACYSYEGEVLFVNDWERCPDCTTPVVWVEDDMTVSHIYHDAVCIQVKLGKGEVAPR